VTSSFDTPYTYGTVKRYICRLIQASEAMCSTIATLQSEVTKQKELIQTRKQRTTGKRIALKGRFVFTTKEVLEIAQKAEKAIAEKTTRIRRHKVPIDLEIEGNEDEGIEKEPIDSEDDCIIAVRCRI
jgi:hypothetical protein